MAEKDPGYLRVKPGNTSAMWVPDIGGYMVPDAAMAYTADDPLVKAHPWAFAPEAEVAGLQREAQDGRDSQVAQMMASLADQPVERATRAPGERRGRVGKGE